MELDHPAEFFETSPIVLKCRKKASDIAGSDAFKRYAALFGGKYMPAAFFVIFLIFSIHIFNDFYFDDPLTQLYYYAASEGQGILPNTLIGFLIPKTTNGMVISNSLKLLYVLMGFIISLCAAGIVKHCAKSGRQKLAGFITAVCFMAFILTQILCLDNFVLNAAVSFTLASVTAYLLVRDRLLFLVPVLCCGAALADLRFAFIFFPYIAAVFLSRIFIRPSENRKKLCLLFALTGLIVLASLFVHYYLTRSMSYTGQNTAFMESFIAANDVPALVYTSFSGYLHDLLNMPAIGLVPSKLPVNLVNGIFLYISFYTADKLRTHWGSKAPAVCYALLLCCIAVLLAVPIIFELNHILPVTCTFFAANGILFLYANESTVKEHLAFLKSRLKKLLICWFVFAAVKYIFDAFFISSTFSKSPYFVDYFEFGFIQRGFVGTLFHLVLGNNMSKTRFYALAIPMYLLCAALIPFIMAKTAKKEKNSYAGQMLVFLTGLYALSPAFSLHFEASSFLHVDIYFYLLSFLCLYILYKNSRWVAAVPLLCACCMLIHQIFASLLFPMIFIIFTYRCFSDSQGHTVRNVCVYAVTILVVCAMFVYLMFFSGKNIALTVEQAYDLVNLRSGGFYIPSDAFFKGVLFSDLSYHAGRAWDMITSRQIIRTVLFYLVISPVWIMYIYAFRRTVQTTEGRFAKLAVGASALSVLAVIPCYIIETDYNRWSSAVLGTMMMSVFMLTLMQSEDKKWYRDLRRSGLTAWLFLIGAILTAMGKMEFWFSF